jgi:hypothetical protein
MYNADARPLLTLDPHPAMPAPTAADGLLGVHLTRIRGPFEQHHGELVDYGPIAKEDIGATGLAIHSRYGKGLWTLSLVHTVQIRHGEARATFELDACTGSIVTQSVGGP